VTENVPPVVIEAVLFVMTGVEFTVTVAVPPIALEQFGAV
jgi:hypothetical protein